MKHVIILLSSILIMIWSMIQFKLNELSPWLDDISTCYKETIIFVICVSIVFMCALINVYMWVTKDIKE